MLSKEREKKLINLCRSLIKTPSFSGREKKVAELVKNHMHSNGFDEVIIDKYGSVIGLIKGKDSGKKLLLDAHLDTVEVNKNEWKYDPFAAKIKNDKIYGRGSTDMKGPLAAMITAAANFAEDTDKKFKGDIFISASVYEECFEGIAAREISERVKPDYVIIGEPSSLDLMIGQRGRAEIIIETRGESAHSASPEIGKNAVYSMIEIIQKIRNIKLKEDKVLGKGIFELTDIISAPYPGASVVPNNCKVTFDRRTLINETKNLILEQIKEVIKELQKEDKKLKAEVYYADEIVDCWTGNQIRAEKFYPAWLYDKNEIFIKKAYKALKKINSNSKIDNYSFCTNGSHYAGEKNIPTIGFGPSNAHLAHVKDEYIEIDQLKRGYMGYYKIIEEMLV